MESEVFRWSQESKVVLEMELESVESKSTDSRLLKLIEMNIINKNPLASFEIYLIESQQMFYTVKRVFLGTNGIL